MANYLTVAGTNAFVDASGAPLANGTLVVEPTSNFRTGDNKQATVTKLQRSITNGSADSPFQLANPAFTSPQNIGYTFRITDLDSGSVSVIENVLIADAGDGSWNIGALNTGVYQKAIPVAAGPQGPPALFRGAWVSGTTYAAGDNVSFTDGSLYASLQNSNTGNTPSTTSTWWGVAVSGADLTSALSDNFALFTKAGYIFPSSGGSFIADPNWMATDFLDLTRFRPISYGLENDSAVAIVSFYDASKAFISEVKGNASGPLYIAIPAVPANARYIRYTMHVIGNGSGVTDYRPDAATQFFRYVVPGSSLLAGLSVIDTLEAQSGSILSTLDVASLATINGYIEITGGTLVADGNWRSTDFLPCLPGQSVSVDLYGVSAMSCISFYSSSGSCLQTNQGPAEGYLAGTFTAPASSASYRLSMASTTYKPGKTATASLFYSGSNIGSLFGQVADLAASPSSAALVPFRSPHKLQLQSSDKGLLYGDSRFSSDYAFNASAWAAVAGFPFRNGGFSGSTVAYQAMNAQTATIWSYGGRVVVWLPGGNDTGAQGTVGTFSGLVPGEAEVTPTNINAEFPSSGTSFIQAIDHVMRKFRAQYDNWRGRAGLTGSESESAKNTLIAAVLKPILVVCTDIPQQRNNSGDPYSQTANWMRKRAAIIECGIKNQVHTLDTMKLFVVNMALEPYWVTPTDKVTNNGNKYMDGLHPNQFGHQDIAQIGCADIGL